MATPDSRSTGEKIRTSSRQRRQERKKAQQLATKTGIWERCLYKVPGKDRYCAQERSPDSSDFCATHMQASSSNGKGKRVPCPVDPSHTVFEKLLESHLKICNLTRQRAEQERQPYYSKGINSGPPVESRENCGTSACACGHGGGVRVGDGTGEPGQSEAPLDEAFVLDVISRVSAAHCSYVGNLPVEILDPPEVQTLHRARVEVGTGFRKGRHVLQQASFVGHMLKRGLAGHGAKILHVEMGAGRGGLGQAIAASFPGSEITMVERSSVRRKADNRVNGASTRVRIDIRDLNMAGLPSLTAEGDTRLVVAVAKHLCGVAADLALRAMLSLPPTHRTSSQSQTQHEDNTGGEIDDNILSDRNGDETAVLPSPGAESAATIPRPVFDSGRVGGVAIATCCHHACVWRDYTGREFLLGLGFSHRDFEAMRRVSAWINLEPLVASTAEPLSEEEKLHSSTPTRDDREGISQAPCSHGTARLGSVVHDPNGLSNAQNTCECEDGHIRADGAMEAEAPGVDGAGLDRPRGFPALSAAEKAAAARECKRLLDRGRMWFVEQRLGLRCEIVHYVERTVTPENALLLGFRDGL